MCLTRSVCRCVGGVQCVQKRVGRCVAVGARVADVAGVARVADVAPLPPVAGVAALSPRRLSPRSCAKRDLV